ncbi:DegV family protein [Bacillus smithii]|jgi:DegV family protein with EDD domain|uniref:DegV family protein n=1 Tax=Bacillus smithii TaxID=1479 RepID=UPI00065DC917|nr:DegV family protein [Bacillus smithii]AKP46358.1 DegV family protein [Bacillus smithii]MED4884806.1 DegV family protein [Bacillus smithii]MED4926767.1 DegV family protein [Bacillus smithii]
MAIRLFTDSGSDLPLSFFQEHSVTLIPLIVQLENKAYEDILSIDPKTIHDAIRNGASPSTSQPSPDFFMKHFTELAESGDSGIYIAFSSELSGTYQTAVMIRDQVKETYPSLDLTIIDSKCASLGQGLAVIEAAKMLESGASKESIVEEITFRCRHMEHLFTVEDLDFLARGGRLSRASAFLGGLLNIKPLLHVEDGKLVPIEKIRGRKKLFKRMLDLMEERGADLSSQMIGISHGDDEQTALEVKQMIEERFGCRHFFIHSIGGAIGSHAGPGTLAIFFLNELRKSDF